MRECLALKLASATAELAQFKIFRYPVYFCSRTGNVQNKIVEKDNFVKIC